MNTQAKFGFADPAAIVSTVDATLPPLPSLDGIDQLGFDTETTTEPRLQDRKLVGISYYLPSSKKRYVPIRHPGGGNYDETMVKCWATAELHNKTLVVANAKHENETMLRWGCSLEVQGCGYSDVFHQAALLNDHRYKLNLSLIAEEEGLGTRIDADHSKLWEMPAGVVAPIAVEDAELAWKLHRIYNERIVAEGLETVLQLENDLVFATCEMERNGAYLDVDKLYVWDDEIRTEWEARVLGIYRETGLHVNPNSWRDMARLFKLYNLSYPFTAPTENSPGQPSFPEEFLETVDHPVIKMAKEARQLDSLRNKYTMKYKRAVESDGRLRYQLHQLRGDEHGTITGRYSSSGDKKGGANIQQVSVQEKQPKLLQRWPIRELFIPPKGRVWFSADASQIEFRIFAHYAELLGVGKRLAEAYRRDPKTDFHVLVVAWTGLVRAFAKNISFCKLYGGGPDKVALMLKVLSDEARRLVRKYDHEFPEAKILLKIASDQAEKVGYVRTFLGRRRRYRLGDKFYSALNSVFQGTAADCMKLKTLELYRERKRLDLTMRFTVHDELDGDLPGAYALPFADQVLNAQTIPLLVPIRWDGGIGANWAEAH